MFMPAHALMDGLTSNDGARGEAISSPVNAGMVSKKLQQSKDEGLYDDIAASGVQEPVSVFHTPNARGMPTLTQGNHRLVSQNDINPNAEVPMLHYDNYGQSVAGGYPTRPSQRPSQRTSSTTGNRPAEPSTGGIDFGFSPSTPGPKRSIWEGK